MRMPVVQPDQPLPGEPVARDVPDHLRSDSPAEGAASSPTEGLGAGTDAPLIEAWQRDPGPTPQLASIRRDRRRARVIPQRTEPGLAHVTGELSVSVTHGRSNRRMAVAAGITLVAAAVGLIGYLFTGFGDEIGTPGAIDRSPQVMSGGDGLDLNTGAGLAPQSIERLARSTVQLIGLTDTGQPACAGSGVIVGTDGTILTNAHVVTSGPGCEFSTIGVGVIADSTSPAQLSYVAQVLVVDRDLDLAVLRVSGLLDSAPGPLPISFPAAPLGDSDTVELGDTIRILGYPVIGGETITFTTGSVGGFTAQAGVGNRALIKTDATIAAGNSGGIAVDLDGLVVGIPTKARASENGPAVDCRPVSDTNEDGTVDDDDVCVPVGGFLNGVRPINLARMLLEKAASAEPIGPVIGDGTLGPEIDYSKIRFTNPRFSLGKDKVRNLPIDEVVTAAAGIPEICFFADWSGMPAGAIWDGVWFVDGKADGVPGFTKETWAIGESGENFWICAPGSKETGFLPGVYEIGFFLEGELIFAEGIEITEEPVEVRTIDWVNNIEVEVCGLAINPQADSGQTGLNELPPGVTIAPGQSYSLDLPAGWVVVEAYDCEGNLVADAYNGLDTTKSLTQVIGIED